VVIASEPPKAYGVDELLKKDAESCSFCILIDLIVGSDLKQENIVFWLTGTFDKIKDDAEVVSDTARPRTC
jgi:hypothetical protein